MLKVLDASASWVITDTHAEAQQLERRLIEWHRTCVGTAPILVGWNAKEGSPRAAAERWAQQLWISMNARDGDVEPLGLHAARLRMTVTKAECGARGLLADPGTLRRSGLIQSRSRAVHQPRHRARTPAPTSPPTLLPKMSATHMDSFGKSCCGSTSESMAPNRHMTTFVWNKHG